jgi:hypothetical protein
MDAAGQRAILARTTETDADGEGVWSRPHDAEAKSCEMITRGADWREVSRIVLHIDAEREPDRRGERSTVRTAAVGLDPHSCSQRSSYAVATMLWRDVRDP